MTPESYERVKEVFAAASACGGDARRMILDRECRGDGELRREVESLLDHDAEPRVNLEQAALDIGVIVADRGGAGGSGRRFDRLGPFRILGMLGEGGMGRVYLAEQRKPQRTVALKVIRADVPSEDTLGRFEHEIQMLGRLQHEGIARIHEAGIGETEHGDSLPYIAMEFVQGLPLLEHARAHELSSADRLRLIGHIARAVQHAHVRGVIHRDLKPGNILVDESGQVKILDFGIARCTDPDDDAREGFRTRPGQFVGTLAYMSPEQVEGDVGEVDTRSDVYAIGVIAFELLTGELPVCVEGKSRSEAARVIVEGAPPPLAREFRGDVATIVARAMAGDKLRRYQSAAELAADVERYLRGDPIEARRDSVTYLLRKRLQRFKGVLAAAGLLIVVLTAFAIYAGVQSRREHAVAEHARAYAGFLHQMLRSVDPETAQGRDVTVLREMLGIFARRSSEELEELPHVQIDVQYTIGSAYLSLGMFDEASEMLGSAVELRRRVSGDEHPELAVALLALADAERAGAHHESAERDYREALRILLRVDADAAQTAVCLTSLAELLVDVHGPQIPDEGGRLIRRALRIHEGLSSPDEDARLYTLAVFGQILDAEGDTDAALEVLRETLAIKRRRDGDGALSVAGSLAQLGRALRHSGQFAEAESCLREALEIRRLMLDEGHTARAWPAIQLALVLVERREFTEAEALCREALAVYAAALGTDNRQYREAQADLALVLGASGQTVAARGHYRQVIAWMTRHLGPTDPLVQVYREQLADLGDTG